MIFVLFAILNLKDGTSVKKNNLVQIKTDMDGIQDVTCKRCHKKSERTHKWYYLNDSGYLFCEDCGERLQVLLDEVRESTIEKYIS